MWQQSRDRGLFGGTTLPVGANNDGCWQPCSSSSTRVLLASDSPTHVYLPDTYTPNYTYPLICHLHHNNRSEKDLQNWFPQISNQNFIGLGIRAPFPGSTGLPGQYRWLMHHPGASFAAILDSLDSFLHDWNIHPQRIFLLGEGAGAVVAIEQLLLQKTNLLAGEPQIAGVICASLPQGWPKWLTDISEPASGRVLFLDHLRSADEFAAVEALFDAGLGITFAEESSTDTSTINRWLMQSIDTAVL